MKFKLYADDLETHIRFKRQIGLAPREKLKTNLFYKKDSVFIVSFEITHLQEKFVDYAENKSLIKKFSIYFINIFGV